MKDLRRRARRAAVTRWFSTLYVAQIFNAKKRGAQHSPRPTPTTTTNNYTPASILSRVTI